MVNSNTTPILDVSETGDWSGIALHKVAIIVNQKYDKNEPTWYRSRFVADSTVRILAKLGIEVVDKPPFDATVTINITGKPRYYNYNPTGKLEDGGVTSAPTAAYATVWISIDAENKKLLAFGYSSLAGPLLRIVGDFPLSETPMDEAIAGALVPNLAKIWGQRVIVTAIEDSDDLISDSAAYTVEKECSLCGINKPGNWQGFFSKDSKNWDTVDQEVLLALADAYAHRSYDISFTAYEALKKITGGYLDPSFPNLLPVMTPEILEALNPINSETLNFDAQARIISIKPEAFPSFVKLLENKNEPIRTAAGQALFKIGKQAVPALVQALESNVYKVPGIAADILGAIGPDAKDAVPALIQALNRKYYGFEDYNINSALREITGHFAYDYDGWQSWLDKQK
jgi:hypothetical protein